MRPKKSNKLKYLNLVLKIFTNPTFIDKILGYEKIYIDFEKLNIDIEKLDKEYENIRDYQYFES